MYALSTEKFEQVEPATAAPPPVRYDGPALFDEARRPIEDHYQAIGTDRLTAFRRMPALTARPLVRPRGEHGWR
ncbi:hypothetical protein [Micromonospora sp. CNB394]|uniref:hypothetical protein n=1 Tax=Micromonospora sp. CNB394 TaxID=1169151 RepID=UPI00036FFC20|nr:hypothetical protein [Micromonospora sp. CNB394]